MADKNFFERYEIKYLLTSRQAEIIKAQIRQNTVSDPHGQSTVCNLYLDTPDSLLIRRSTEKPVYKEKLRIRCYGRAQANSKVFVELKNKCESVVYKRRMALPLNTAMEYINGNAPQKGQVAREIDYRFKIYGTLAPKMFIAYDREAFYLKDDENVRITFDKNILWRDSELFLDAPIYGNRVIDSDTVLMELKVSAAVPLWLTSLLSKQKLYKTSFSKYGTAYMNKLSLPMGGIICNEHNIQRAV